MKKFRVTYNGSIMDYDDLGNILKECMVVKPKKFMVRGSLTDRIHKLSYDCDVVLDKNYQIVGNILWFRCKKSKVKMCKELLNFLLKQNLIEKVEEL